MKKKTLSELAASMEGRDTTFQWDVLVSYDEDKVNSILDANPIAALEEFPKFSGKAVVENDEDEREEREYQFTLSLLRPHLRFKSSYGQVVLSAEMEGTFQTVSPRRGKAKDLPTQYNLEIEADLVNVDGKEPADSVSTNHVVDLGSDSTASRNICLNFDRSKATISGGPTNTREKMTAAVKEALRDGLATALSKNIKNHFISGVNRKGADAEGTVLKPRSFCFTIMPADTANKVPGILCMWIAVDGGHNNGKRPSGTTNLVFSPDGGVECPLPDNCSASIIFSHDLITSQLFKPSLEKVMNEIQVTSTKGTAGMIVTGKWKTGSVKISGAEGFWPDNKPGGAHCRFDGLEFQTTEPEAVLTVKPGISTAVQDAVVIKYTSGQKKVGWQKNYIPFPDYTPPSFDNNFPSKGISCPMPESGTVLLNFTWMCRGLWHGGTNEHPNMLGLTLSNDNNWSVDVKSDPSDRTFFGRIFGFDQAVPDHYKKLDVPSAKLKVVMNELDYFLTTNVLFPGKHVFHAHKLDKKNSELGLGLATPRDLILTGDIKLSR